MGKITDQINQFTETYTSIVVGMHSDINQYRREVKALQSKNIDLELNLYKILNDAKSIEQSNLQTAENIENKKAEIKDLYEEIASSVKRINTISSEIEKATGLVDSLNLKVVQTVNDIGKLNKRILEEQGKNLSLKTDFENLDSKLQQATQDLDDLRQKNKEQDEQITTQKMLIIGGFFLLVFILALTILL